MTSGPPGGWVASYNPPMRRQPTFTRAQGLPALLAQRIAIIDGAMGTMIQRYKLGEADFRGARFADHPKDLKGNKEISPYHYCPELSHHALYGLRRQHRPTGY